MSAVYEHSVLNKCNLTKPIHLILSQKLKIFSQLFSAFLKSSLNFEHWEKIDDLHS